MLRAQITEAMKDAMRAREPETLSTVRMILQTMVKQRRESVSLYRQGGRADLVAKEEGEIAVIERFLPQQMDAAGTDAAIIAAIAETGAASIKDMGKVMAALKAKYSGQMDFSTVGPAVKAKLGG